MKKWMAALTLCFMLFVSFPSFAQCSVCTRTAQQLGEKPAKGLNAGILYLAFTPFAIVGFIAYRYFKNNRA
jgi:hypothetical protein